MVGDGAKVSFWLDQWLGTQCLKYNFPRLFSLSNENDISLKLLVERNGCFRGWNLNFHRALFAWEAEELDRLYTILNQSLIRTYNKLDQWKWLPCSSGQFSCSSLYHLLLSSGSVGVSKMLWSNVSPPKVQFLGLLAWKGKLKTSVFLNRIGVLGHNVSVNCVFCRSHVETVSHVMLWCPFVWQIWSDLLNW